ncbi:MAG: hypothetical protein F4160_03080, partial [Rhodospirillaceae bacterium]|nr:hypothetical protein [Rhodospirillaceae bacterium]
SRPYPLLQNCGPDESPQLPYSYAKMFNLVVRPKRWFATMDPLVDQWRAQFYPEIEDWSAYDSLVSAARPEAFDAIVEIYGAAPRLAGWIERHPALLDNLQDREFTDLDLPKGFGPDPEAEAIARRGLTRLYWTHEFGVAEMKERIAETPVQDVRDTVESVRNWSNDKAFQIAMHTLRGNLTPVEAGTALSNLAEAAIAAVLSAVADEFADRLVPRADGGVAAAVLGDLASREAAPGAALDILFVYEGGSDDSYDGLCWRFLEALRELSRDSLFLAPIPGGRKGRPVRSLAGFAEHFRTAAPAGDLLELTRARCIFEHGAAGIGQRFEEARREALGAGAARDTLIAELREAGNGAAEPGLSALEDMRGGVQHVERAARLLQLLLAGDAPDDPAPAAASVFHAAAAQGRIADDAAEDLAEAATLWRNLRGALRLVADDGESVIALGSRARAVLAQSCGRDDVDALRAAIGETAARAAAQIGIIDETADCVPTENGGGPAPDNPA